MRAAVALTLTLTMTMAGCFPHDPHKRTIAKYAEGGSLIAGIIVSAVSNTGADCDSNDMTPGSTDPNCRTKAQVLSTIGVTLILAGLLGFIATVSTAEDEDKTSSVTTTTPDTKPKPNTTNTTTTTTKTTTNTQATDPGGGPGASSGVTAGSASVSGEGSGSGTTQPTP